MFNDKPEARAFLEYLSTGASTEVMVRNGGGISPHQDSSLDWYGTDIDRRIAEILLNAETVRFDASDLMPGEVGAGTFWSAMVDYVTGTVDLDEALAEIDASWPEGAAGAESVTEESMEEEPTFLDRAMAGEFDGTEVNVMSVLVDADEQLFLESIASFEEETGIDIVHSGTKEFETQIVVRLDAGDAPDIAMMPQPGLLERFVAEGFVPVDVREFIPEADLQERYTQGWLDSATFAGPDGEDLMAGVWWKAANKDLVWYPKALFEEAGYEVPTTWDELIALNEQIKSDGDAPWCIGIESGNATGWVATDWIEGLMLRTAPAEDYDAWVAGELPFSSDQVKNAAQLMSDVWLTEGNVLGGTNQIVTEFIGDSPTHMFEDPPTCWMHKQASWIQGFFGEGLEPGVDYDFFYFPPVDPAYGEPVLMAGDIYTMFNDKPEARAFLEYLSTGASTEVMVRNGGGISPHQDSSLDWYGTEIDRRIAEILLNAETVRFDASDLMPGEVGAGTFWSAMVDYVTGTVDLDGALAEIDASWPQE
jgi:alpha-glucoside transport system substrate-binding protein